MNIIKKIKNYFLKRKIKKIVKKINKDRDWIY
jgi:hypothetical protein